MTLPDLEEHEEENNNPHQHSVTEALIEVIKLAAEEGRITLGVHECIKLLGNSAEEVMLCLIAKWTGSQDAAVKIEHVLIKAFCQEGYIDLLHVHDQVKLTKLLVTCLSQSAQDKPQNVIKPPMEENSAGYSCIMIKYPKHDTSPDEDMVAEYIKHEQMTHAEPFVALPD
ncbi:growth arrest and DNA damage-inducible protein GADD45 alpha-like [Littorina saxatilis]|uniref:Ribosomal protein eL8/eL30/eS12/Gadd45 domain-containing protein n=1 Tax=Littorina saxatilis TaxID=31220 RepID=A0AAN9B7S2_9CAEN